MKTFAIPFLFLLSAGVALAGYRTLQDENRFVTVRTETVGVESVWFCYPDKLECDVTTTNVSPAFAATVRIEPHPDWDLLAENGTDAVPLREIVLHPGEQARYRVRNKDSGELSPWGLIVMFRADAVLAGVGEAQEDSEGAFLPEIPEQLSPDDDAFRFACRPLRFSLLPHSPPTPDFATLTWHGVRLFEVGDDGGWTELRTGVRYRWNELEGKDVRVAGSLSSETERDRWIRVEHDTNKCADTARCTVVKALSVEVAGRGWATRDWKTEETIAAGALSTDPHQADVRVSVFPSREGMPILVRLDGGLGHAEGFDAALSIGGRTLGPVDGFLECSTGAGGSLTGFLTSSDVVGETCVIQAGNEAASLSFVWDEHAEEDEWTLSPDCIPEDGIVQNLFRLRLHAADSDMAPFQPLSGHEIRMFVEEVVFEDGQGEEQTLSNTPESPSDLSAWAEISPASDVCDADGETEFTLSVNRENVVFVRLVAYDWTVFVSARTATPLRQAPRRTPPSGDARTEHLNRTNDSVNNPALGPFVILCPDRIPVSPSADIVARCPNPQGIAAMVGGVVRVWPFFWNGTGYAQIAGCQVRFRKESDPPTAANWTTISEPGTSLACDPASHALHASVNQAWDFVVAPNEPGTYQSEVRFRKRRGEEFTSIFSFSFTAFEGALAANNAQFDFPINDLACAAFLRGREPSPTTVTTTIELKAETNDQTPLPDRIILIAPSGFSDLGNTSLSASSEMFGIVNGIGRFSGSHIETTIKSEYQGKPNSIVHQEQSRNRTLTRAGRLRPVGLAVFDMYVAAPTGPVPAAGEAGNAGSDGPDDALWVFDSDGRGNCSVVCKAAPLNGISDDSVRQAIWSRLAWTLPDCGEVAAVPNGVPANGSWTFVYPRMPADNSAFGTKEDGVTLSIPGTDIAPWKQTVQFRFKKEGTGASAQISSPNVKPGDPNWYVYWHQVAESFDFGPQCPLVYDPSPRGDNSENEIGRYRGKPVYNSSTHSYQWQDTITLFDDNKSNIVECVTTIHHENGHRQSRQKPNAEGGWGPNLLWTLQLDTDWDLICDQFETNPKGMLFSIEYVIDETGAIIQDCDAILRDKNAWISLDHSQTGTCSINENVVSLRAQDLRQEDWSFANGNR